MHLSSSDMTDACFEQHPSLGLLSLGRVQVMDALGPKARDELIDLMCRKESAVYMQVLNPLSQPACTMSTVLHSRAQGSHKDALQTALQ